MRTLAALTLAAVLAAGCGTTTSEPDTTDAPTAPSSTGRVLAGAAAVGYLHPDPAWQVARSSAELARILDDIDAARPDGWDEPIPVGAVDYETEIVLVGASTSSSTCHLVVTGAHRDGTTVTVDTVEVGGPACTDDIVTFVHAVAVDGGDGIDTVIVDGHREPVTS